MPDKTKAALQGRQCRRTELTQGQDSTLICLVNPARVICLCESQTPETALASGKGCSDMSNGQPFGSMPRCCNSFRSIRLIQVANDESPSLRISSSSWARKSSGKRIWYCGDFFNSCIDMCNYPDYYLSVITRVITFQAKCNAPNCANSIRASDHNVNASNEAAMKDHTTHPQGRNSYTWRFLCHTSEDTSSPLIVILTVAATEEEARANCSGFNPVFAARLPFHSFEFVEVHHA